MLRWLAPGLLILLLAGSAAAHPFGTKIWGHRLRAVAQPEAIAIDYVIEIPMTKLARFMDVFKRQRNWERLGPEEEARFNDALMAHLRKNLVVTVDGERVPLEWNPHYAKESGRGEAGFFEFRLHLQAPIAGDTPKHIDIHNDNFRLQRAVFSNEVRSWPGATATEASVASGMGWASDEGHRRIAFTWQRGGTGTTAAADESRTAAEEDARLLTLLRQEMTPQLLWIALVTALFLGGAHALSPGHGKALVAAYLVGSHGTVRHAIALGGVVTATHIASVVVLGLVGLLLAQYIVPEYYTPFISLGSGLIIVGIGIWLLVRRLLPHRHHHHHHHGKPQEAPSWRELVVLGISGGIVPCPTATVVMLTAIAIGRVGLGFLLIAAFSVGLALVLTTVGLLTVRARRFALRLPRSEQLLRWLPVASACVVTLLGLLVIYRGFWVEWRALH